MERQLIRPTTEAAEPLWTRAVKRHGIRPWSAALLLVMLAATGVVTPMFFLGNVSGHDFQFHLASWMDAAGQWREGILYPRWAEWANWGFGEPRFIFYPPASWMIGAALGSVLPWSFAPIAFIWLALTASGMAMWRLAREWLPWPQAAAAAIFFAVNPYHLVLVYYRSDFAELLAGTLWPLLVWSALHVTRREWRHVPLLAVFLAGIWLSNTPAGVIATYSLALLLAVACVIGRNAWPMILGGAAIAAGFGLAAFYILPAAWELRWVQIGQVLSNNLDPAQNFIFTHSNDPEFLFFNWKVSGVVLGVMLLTGIAAVLSARRREALGEIWWAFIALGAAAVLLMFHPSLPLWRHLPELRFVQFPWRWLEPLGVVFAFLAAAAMDFSHKRWESWIGAAAIVAMIAGMATLIARDTWWSDDTPFLANSIAAGHGYDGTDEYAPLKCNRYELPGYMADPDEAATPVKAAPRIGKIDSETGKIAPATGVRLHVERWSAEGRNFEAETAKPITLAIRMVNYPAWEIRVDGEITRVETEPTTAEILVAVPAGIHRVEAQFRRTWDREAGGIISLLSATGLMALAWGLRRAARASPTLPRANRAATVI